MNDSMFAAHRSASHRAAQLARENEIIRSHAERHAATDRPVSASWLTSLMARLTKTPRVVQPQAAFIATAP